MEIKKQEIIKKIKEKAFWKYDGGDIHIKTSESGLHTNQYLNTDYIISDTNLTEKIVKVFFVEEVKKLKLTIDWVISYPPFGLTIAHEFAKQINAKFGYINLDTSKCYFNIKKNAKILIVCDDIYSGKSIKKIIEVLKINKAKFFSPIFSIGNFSNKEEIGGLKIFSVISEKGKLFKEDNCPICKNNSKALLPRENWEKFIS